MLIQLYIYRKAFCLSITDPRLWNNLDNSIRNISNFNTIKIALKMYLLNSYHYIFNCPFKFIFLNLNLLMKIFIFLMFKLTYKTMTFNY